MPVAPSLAELEALSGRAKSNLSRTPDLDAAHCSSLAPEAATFICLDGREAPSSGHPILEYVFFLCIVQAHQGFDGLDNPLCIANAVAVGIACAEAC